MTTSTADDPRHFAFLSVADLGTAGVCGGMLVVNLIGRPVEFHCTTPVQPNRTQEILYGATLKQFLFCEQIGGPILAQAKTRPGLVMIHQQELLPLHANISQPLILLQEEAGDIETNLVNGRQLSNIQLGQKFLTLLVGGPDAPVRRALQAFHSALPIEEPFERIRQAIDEAHAAAR